MRKRKMLFYAIFFLTIALSSCTASAKSTPAASTAKAHVQVTPTATSIPPVQLTPVLPATTSVGIPQRLRIPRLGVDAPVENVGILPGGDLATPTQHPWEGVGWYSNGPRPGERGSAVIDGHLDRPGGYPAVFWYLGELQTGDEVIVVDLKGRQIHFRVTRVVAYAPQQAPLQEIFGDMGGSYLNLITCAGAWIPSEHQTTQRLVVYTTLT